MLRLSGDEVDRAQLSLWLDRLALSELWQREMDESAPQ